MVVVLSCLLCACASIRERSVKVDEKIMMPVAKRSDLVTSKEPSGQYWSLNANPAMSK